MPRKQLCGRVGLLAVLAPALLWACGGEKKPPSDETKTGAGGADQGGTLVVGMRTDFGGFNPITNVDQYTDELIKYALFTPLIQHDRELKATPWLAEKWEMTGDTGVVFDLRHDVYWSDGQKLTAEDVKFTFDLAKNPVTASLLASAYLENVDRAEVEDSFTVRFHFSRPHAQAIEDFWWAPVPKHVLEKVAPADLRNAAFNRNPVGSGPYHLGEWRANDRLVLDREMLFPKALGGPPPLDRVVFRIVPEPSTILTELLSAGIQVDIPLTPEQVAQVERNAADTVFAYPSRTVYFIAWNNQRPPFNDPAIRRAMTYAIDREQVVKAMLAGHGEVADGPIPPWSPLFPKVKPLPYDQRQAEQLLQKAGWVDRNGDGIRENAQGQAFEFTLLTSNSPLTKGVAEVVQALLKGVGVKADIQVLEFQTFLQQYKARKFDAVFANWVLDNFQVGSAPYALFSSKLAAVPLSSNRAGVQSAKLDQLMTKASSETDPGAARGAWGDFVKELENEQPFTFMFWLDELAASDRRVHGVVMDPRGEMQSVARWWVSGGRIR